jgi:4-carboxymuconolactone decarboxylase
MHSTAFIHTDPENGALVGPFAALIHTPAVSEAYIAKSKAMAQLATETGLPRTAREVAILVVGVLYGADYELYAHSRLAVKFGLPVETVRTLCKGEELAKDAEGMDEKCWVAHDVAHELACPTGRKGVLSAANWERANKVFGKEGTLALVHYIAHYAYTCVVLNAIDAPIPEGETLLP